VVTSGEREIMATGAASDRGDRGEQEGVFTGGITSQGWLGSAAELLRRRVAGEYEVDEFGYDPDFNELMLMPIARLLYQHWFRVQMRGLEHIPAAGAALVVTNHSGVLPWDALMIQVGLLDNHPGHRQLRLLAADLVYSLPVLSHLSRKSGHTLACPADADRLLATGHLVGVCPEGFKGTGKPFRQRYRLERFGRGGFAASAIRANVPIVPCAVVGAEETYPMLANAKPLARLFGLPYFPITPLFPWFGLLGMVPLPSRWIIEFGEPVDTAGYAADDPGAVFELTDQVRETIQRKLDDLVVERGPAFG
jgi:1-acyl-sn-glycerol-3-phosphate acyltransferase